MTRDAGDGRPTGRFSRFDRVAPAVRHLWSLLYRATRRHAVLLDRQRVALDELTSALDTEAARLARLYGFVTRAIGRYRGELQAVDRRLTELERRAGVTSPVATRREDGEP